MHRVGPGVAVLDKQDEVGFHQTGHNSGVLHAGFYYTRDSLKARFTPSQTIETTKETIEWVREQTPLGRKS